MPLSSSQPAESVPSTSAMSVSPCAVTQPPWTCCWRVTTSSCHGPITVAQPQRQHSLDGWPVPLPRFVTSSVCDFSGKTACCGTKSFQDSSDETACVDHSSCYHPLLECGHWEPIPRLAGAREDLHPLSHTCKDTQTRSRCMMHGPT